MLKDIFNKKENQVMLVVVLLSIVLILIGFYLLQKSNEFEATPRQIPNDVSEIKWKEFENTKYNFVLSYPEHFIFAKDDETYGPVFNFYFNTKEEEPPLTHLMNESHFSIYPLGLPVQGTTLSFSESIFTSESGQAFTLKDFQTLEGDTWALMAVPVDTPLTWKSWGFVWISSRVSDREYKCYEGGVEIEFELCNPLEGDQIEVSGEVDKDFIETGRAILNTLELF